MKAKLLMLLVVLVSVFAINSSAQINSTPIRWVRALPATCVPTARNAVLVYKFTATTGVYRCSATNTWTAVGSGSSFTTDITVSKADPFLSLYDTTSTDFDWRIRNGALGNNILDFYDVTAGLTAMQIKGGAVPGGVSAVSIGTLAPPTEATLFIANSHSSGTNLDIRHLEENGCSTLELQPASYTTDFKTAYFQTCGSTTAGNYLTGVPTANASALIFSDRSAGVIGTFTTTPLVFGTNGLERVRITGAGIMNLPYGAAVASAAAIAPTGNTFHVTGTTNITSITSTGIIAGTEITIIFDGILTFTDGSNLKLAGDFVTTADDVITLKFDGTDWYEKTRAVN